MNTLSHYERFSEPILIRKDYVKDHHGLGYHGSKLRDPQALFKTNLPPKDEGQQHVYHMKDFTRPMSGSNKKASAERPVTVSDPSP